MCQVSKKQVIANNKYMKTYDTNITSSYINYLDANSLYGLAMSHKLPCGELQWSDDIYDTDDIVNYNDGDDGYILGVDLEYPEHSIATRDLEPAHHHILPHLSPRRPLAGQCGIWDLGRMPQA